MNAKDVDVSLELISDWLKRATPPEKKFDRCPVCDGRIRKAAFVKAGQPYSQCRVCSLSFWNPRYSQAQLSAFWNSGFWKSCRRGYPGQPRVHFTEDELSQLTDLTAQVVAKSQVRMIDVGCGTGGLLLHFQEQFGWDVRGIDLNAPEHEIWSRFNVPARVMPLEEIVDSQEQFDVVTCSEVLEHVLDPATFFANLTKIVSQNGVLILTFPRVGTWAPRLLRGCVLPPWPPNHINHYERGSIRALCARNGMRLICWKTTKTPLFDWGLFARSLCMVQDYCSGFPGGRPSKMVEIPRRVYQSGTDRCIQYIQERDAAESSIWWTSPIGCSEYAYRDLTPTAKAVLRLQRTIGIRQVMRGLQWAIQRVEGGMRAMVVLQKNTL